MLSLARRGEAVRQPDVVMIERRERAKVLLHQESLTSIAADAIACRLSCWRAGQLLACSRGGARARGLRRIRVIQN
jgi:hypothetical protein